MSRKNTAYEFDCARETRDYARNFVADLFPKAKIELSIARLDGEVGVSARVIGNTAPYIPADIIECLGELGVRPVSMVESQA